MTMFQIYYRELHAYALQWDGDTATQVLKALLVLIRKTGKYLIVKKAKKGVKVLGRSTILIAILCYPPTYPSRRSRVFNISNEFSIVGTATNTWQSCGKGTVLCGAPRTTLACSFLIFATDSRNLNIKSIYSEVSQIHANALYRKYHSCDPFKLWIDQKSAQFWRHRHNHAVTAW